MSANAQEVYQGTVQYLSPVERFRLATLILNELAQQNLPSIIGDSPDHQDFWTEEDQLDVVDFSLQYAAAMFSNDEAI